MVCSFFRAKNSGITNWFKESCCRPYESPPPSESGNHQRRRSQPKHQSDFQIEHQHHPGNGSSNGGRDKTTFISPTNKSSKHQNRQVHVSKKTNQSLQCISNMHCIADTGCHCTSKQPCRQYFVKTGFQLQAQARYFIKLMPLRYWSQSISVQSSLRHHSRTGSALRRGSERAPERRTSSSKRFAKSRQWQLQRRAKEKPRVTHPPRGCYNQQDSSTKIPREVNSRTFHSLKAGITFLMYVK